MTDRLPQPLRSDASHNRERILDAARALFATEGLDVPMRQVARRAGVGPATLYRRFPTKQLLVTEAFAGQMHTCRGIVDDGLADPDPWHGLCRMLERICALHAGDRGFTEAFMAAYPKALDFAAERSYTLTSAAELVRRAKTTGQLRADVVLEDLIMVIMANRGIHATSSAARVVASRRFTALLIDALRASPGSSELPPVGRVALAAPGHG